MSAVATTSEPRSTTLAGTSSGACWMKRESCAEPSQATPRIRSAAQSACEKLWVSASVPSASRSRPVGSRASMYGPPMRLT